MTIVLVVITIVLGSHDYSPRVVMTLVLGSHDYSPSGHYYSPR